MSHIKKHVTAEGKGRPITDMIRIQGKNACESHTPLLYQSIMQVLVLMDGNSLPPLKPNYCCFKSITFAGLIRNAFSSSIIKKRNRCKANHGESLVRARPYEIKNYSPVRRLVTYLRTREALYNEYERLETISTFGYGSAEAL